ncbi:hypothetical protein AD006_10900 [Pseudonocardia sp. EC080610-09]|nr:hypothetical protein AD006_10900 [Pseudonocardia sp. EC080610-09]
MQAGGTPRVNRTIRRMRAFVTRPMNEASITAPGSSAVVRSIRTGVSSAEPVASTPPRAAP